MNQVTINPCVKIAFLCVILLSILAIMTGYIPSMIYIFVYIILMLLGIGFDKSINKSHKILVIIFLTFFIGLRDFGIGTDTNVYIYDYFINAKYIDNITELINHDKGDKGFLLLAVIARIFGNDTQNLLLFTALFIYTFTLYSIKQFKYNNIKISLTIFLFLWCFTFLNDSMNAMRQFCAMSIVLCGFSYLLNRNWKVYVLLQFLAFFMHSSSVIALPLLGIYYFSSYPNKKKRNLITIIFLLCLLLSIGSIFTLLPLLANWGIISVTYADRYGAYSEFSSVNIFGPAFIAKTTIIYLLIYYNKKRNAINDKIAYLSYTIHSIAFILKLTAFFVIYLSRISLYYDYIDIYLLAIILTNNKAPRIYVYGLCICIVYLWFTSYIIGNSAETYPYESEILGIY